MQVFRYDEVDGQASLMRTWYELRKQLYLREELIAGDDLDASGSYDDVYDQYSTHVLLFDQASPSEAVGTCRIIDGRTTELQVSRQFGVTPRTDSVEVSGFAVLPSYRKSFLTLGCYWFVYHWAVRRNYKEVHFEVEIPFADSLSAIGLPIERTGPEKFVYNAINVPLKVSLDSVVDSLRIADAERAGTTHFADLFAGPCGNILDLSRAFAKPTAKNEGEIVA